MIKVGVAAVTMFWSIERFLKLFCAKPSFHFNYYLSISKTFLLLWICDEFIYLLYWDRYGQMEYMCLFAMLWLIFQFDIISHYSTVFNSLWIQFTRTHTQPSNLYYLMNKFDGHTLKVIKCVKLRPLYSIYSSHSSLSLFMSFILSVVHQCVITLWSNCSITDTWQLRDVNKIVS